MYWQNICAMLAPYIVRMAWIEFVFNYRRLMSVFQKIHSFATLNICLFCAWSGANDDTNADVDMPAFVFVFVMDGSIEKFLLENA